MGTKILQRVEVNLRSFYIFNSSLSKKEGEEHKKILYYHPDDIELNTKIKDVGLSEAIITFTGTFTADESCKALHTQKTTQLFYQPEPGFWMVLVLNVPKEIRFKEGLEEVGNYCGGEVQDSIYRAVLEQCYNMFRLFNGTFQMNFATDTGAEQLRQRMTEFYDKHLSTLKLSACDVWELTRSIQYLPLDKFLFLRAHNFINMIKATFPIIKETIFLYNEQVVCSGKLDPIDLYSLHEYIVSTLLAKGNQTELNSATLVRSNSSASNAYRNGGFMLGPEDEGGCTKPPKVFLKKEDSAEGGSTNEKKKMFHLIIYRASNATLCLFVDDYEQLQKDFYTELHSYMGPQLSNLERDIGEKVLKQQSHSKTVTPTDDDGLSPKYLFINEQSLKHLSNISIDRRRPKTAQSIPTNIMNLIADLRNEPNDSSNPFEEVLVKATNDFWIVKRLCNWRQYYVIIFNSKSTLLDVTQEAKRIFEQELTDDVFFDK